MKRAICSSRCSASGRTTDGGGSGYAESGDAGGWRKGASARQDLVPSLASISE
ncbi:MAG: hypothetical protein J7L54_04700 [Elusimicrobia bacterium]|nr:hypothetical protein [Elusimicrobiota bacterium]